MALKVLILVFLAEIARSQTVPSTSADADDIIAREIPACESSTTCDECLANDNHDCVWMANHGQCQSSCPSFPDKNCYHPRLFGPVTTDRHEICQVARYLYKDNVQCYRQPTPTSCHRQMGCYWLSDITDDGENSASWCVLHLESTKMEKSIEPAAVENARPLLSVAASMARAQPLPSESSTKDLTVFLPLALGGIMLWIAL